VIWMIRCLNLKHEHIGFLNIARAGSPKNLETVQCRGLKNTLKKISVTHVIKLGFAPKTYPPWQYNDDDKMYCLCD